MRYTIEYAMLTTKTQVLENLICQKQSKEDTIARYREDPEYTEKLDNWYAEQINNLILEIKAIDELIKIVAK